MRFAICSDLKLVIDELNTDRRDLETDDKYTIDKLGRKEDILLIRISSGIILSILTEVIELIMIYF